MSTTNLNPIVLDAIPSIPIQYNIPQIHKETMIYLTIQIELKSKGWQYASFHNVSLRGKDIFPNKIPEPIDLKLDYSKNLNNKKLFITSHISRFRTDAKEDIASITKYSLKLEAGDILLDQFIKESDTNNPSNFFAFIIFNLIP